MVKINRDHIVGLICIAIAGAVLAITPSFPAGQEGVNLTGPGFFPNVLAIIYILLGVAELAVGFRSSLGKAGDGPAATSAAKPSIRKFLEFVGLLVAFAALFQPLGFIVATILFLFFLMLLLDVKPLKSILFSVVYTGVIFLLFGKLFTIGLPVGILSILGM